MYTEGPGERYVVMYFIKRGFNDHADADAVRRGRDTALLKENGEGGTVLFIISEPGSDLSANPKTH